MNELPKDGGREEGEEDAGQGAFPASAGGGAAEDEPEFTKPTLQLILLLAGVTALGPFAMQSIAPALPTLSDSLAISESAAQSLISAAMLGMAGGSIVYGPLADHFGRRPVLLWGLAISVFGAALACVAPSFGWVLLGRVAQAVGSGAGMVLARAAAQDLFGARGAARAIGQMTAVMVLAPMLAPAIGGAMTQYFGWRGIFAAITLVSFGLLAWVYLRFAETARSLSPQLDIASVAQDYRLVAARPAFRANAVFCGVQMMSFFAFVSAGPYVFERGYGIGPGIYGVMFILAAGAYMGANLMAPRLAEQFGHQGALRAGASLAFFGCGGVAFALWMLGTDALAPGQIDWPGGLLMLTGLCLHALGAGVVTPLGLAGAVAAYPERAGSASSLVGVAQFTAGALAAQTAGLLPLDHGAPIMLAMGGLCMAAYLSYLALKPRRGV